MKPYQMYIDGKFVSAASGKTFNVYDPATDQIVSPKRPDRKPRKRPQDYAVLMEELQRLENYVEPKLPGLTEDSI